MAVVRRAFLLAMAAAAFVAAGAGGNSRPAVAPPLPGPESSLRASAGAPGPASPSPEDESGGVVWTGPPPVPLSPGNRHGELRVSPPRIRRAASPSAVPLRRSPGSYQVRLPESPNRAHPIAAPAPLNPVSVAVSPLSPQAKEHPADPSTGLPTAPGGDQSASGSAPVRTAGTHAVDSAPALDYQPAPSRDDAGPGPSRLTPPRVISALEMAYPGEAFHLTVRRQDLGSDLSVIGAEGTVALRALVLADGTVREVEVVVSSGSEVLDRTASDAVAHWRFAPAARDAIPIDAYVILRIRYVVR